MTTEYSPSGSRLLAAKLQYCDIVFYEEEMKEYGLMLILDVQCLKLLCTKIIFMLKMTIEI